MRSRTAESVGQCGAPWGWFLAWVAVGACAALGLAALLSVGVLLLAAAAVAAVLLLRKGHRITALGALAGPALPLLYLAYSNRGGPGTVCRSTATETICTDEFAPLPFLLTGVLLLVASVLVFSVLDRRRGN
ncbi:hypothetical protein [Streptomyces murinus]|uniref:Uncharacterized protein n=1 Tax=Streptomyces murinus TaxID=33900 RepID=A0A7W3RKR6_STRMR|nr:hypothetical protein [Streptomyces murinus]MBA9053265.1 hypothetical protein [Streptomyces murinus]UWW94414.1 hypothetical protein GO605_28915 [Streptomyces murinus]